jgi:hypothetical protein
MPGWIVIPARRVRCGSRIAALAGSALCTEYPGAQVQKIAIRVFSTGRQSGSTLACRCVLERDPPDPDLAVQPLKPMLVSPGHEQHVAGSAFHGRIPAVEHAVAGDDPGRSNRALVLGQMVDSVPG